MMFTGGRLTEGSWIRSDPTQRTRFLGPDGHPVTFKPGNTWIHTVGAQTTIEVEHPQ